jgi:hypothetical protein
MSCFVEIYPASGANAVKKKLMAGHAKAPWELWFELRNTSFEFIQLPAPIALEMMMVFFPGYFISRGVTGDRN